MTIIHELQDGTQLESIAGRVIKPQDAPCVYQLINRINAGKEKGNEKKTQ